MRHAWRHKLQRFRLEWPFWLFLFCEETITSDEAWRQNLKYTLALDHKFAVFLLEDTTQLRKTSTAPLCGLESDGKDVPTASRRTAAQKMTYLELIGSLRSTTRQV